MTVRIALPMAVVAVLVAGCGSESAKGRTDSGDSVAAGHPSVNLVPDGYEGRFRTSATVLESPEHGPQLCFSILESLPPQCGGPDVAGWSWDDVKHEARGGTHWGYYTVVGTFDGTTFTLTEPAAVAAASQSGGSRDDGLTTPCPEPDGGWRPEDPARATDATLEAAVRRARQVEGFGGVWVDQRIPDDELTEQNANDPQRLVLNVTTAGDPEEMRESLRQIWGGSLCVSTSERTQSYLRQVQRELSDATGFVSSSDDEVNGQVDLTVYVATHGMQQQFDDRYGEGVVRLTGALEPID